MLQNQCPHLSTRYFSISPYHSCRGTAFCISTYQHGPASIEHIASKCSDLILTFWDAIKKYMWQGLTDFLNSWVLLPCRANLNSCTHFLLIQQFSMSQMELVTAHCSHFYLLLLFEPRSQLALQFYFQSRYYMLSQLLYCNLYSFYTDTLSSSFNVSTLASAGLPYLYPSTNSYFYSISFSSACTPSNCDKPSDRLLINEH